MSYHMSYYMPHYMANLVDDEAGQNRTENEGHQRRPCGRPQVLVDGTARLCAQCGGGAPTLFSLYAVNLTEVACFVFPMFALGRFRSGRRCWLGSRLAPGPPLF